MLCFVLYYFINFPLKENVVTRTAIGKERLTALYLNCGGTLRKKIKSKLFRLGERREAYGILLQHQSCLTSWKLVAAENMSVWQKLVIIYDIFNGHWRSTDGVHAQEMDTYLLVILIKHFASRYCCWSQTLLLSCWCQIFGLLQSSPHRIVIRDRMLHRAVFFIFNLFFALYWRNANWHFLKLHKSFYFQCMYFWDEFWQKSWVDILQCYNSLEYFLFVKIIWAF